MSLKPRGQKIQRETFGVRERVYRIYTKKYPISNLGNEGEWTVRKRGINKKNKSVDTKKEHLKGETNHGALRTDHGLRTI